MKPPFPVGADINIPIMSLVCRHLAKVMPLALSFSLCATSTTIIAVRTSVNIYIGADSKVSSEVGERRNTLTCKIIQVSNHELFGQAGFDTYGDDVHGTIGDFRATTQKALHEAPSFERGVAQYEKNMRSALHDLMKSGRKIPSDKQAEQAILMETIIAAFRNGKPLLVERGFVNTGGDASPSNALTRDCLDDCSSVLSYSLAGVRDLLSPEAVKRQISTSHDIPSAIFTMIQMESDAHPSQTGGPISIAVIDKTGIRFVNSGLCDGKHRDVK